MVALTAVIAAIVAVAAVERSTPVRDFNVRGYLERDTLIVNSRLGGKVREVCVAQGAHVQAGQVLIRFDQAELQSKYQRMRSALQSVSKDLKAGRSLAHLSPAAHDWLIQANPEVRDMEIAYAGAAAAYEASPPDQRDSLKVQLDRAAAERMRVHHKIARALSAAGEQSSGGADYLLSQAHTLLEKMEAALREGDLVAEQAGVVEILQVKPGDTLLPAKPVAAIAGNSFHLDVLLSGPAANALHVGDTFDARVRSQAARITVASLEKREPSLAENFNAPAKFRVRFHLALTPPNTQAGDEGVASLREIR